MYCKSTKELSQEKLLNCINSSKVYCKYLGSWKKSNRTEVLIVAKCIVNALEE